MVPALLTINGVNSNSRCAPCNAAWEKGHIEGSWSFSTSFPQIIQVGKEGEVDDRERYISANTNGDKWSDVIKAAGDF